jgi:fatty acid desaturase
MSTRDDTTRPRRERDAAAIARGWIAALAFVACLGLVIVGQMTVGWGFLGLQLLGLAGLLTLLGLYNRRFK